MADSSKKEDKVLNNQTEQDKKEEGKVNNQSETESTESKSTKADGKQTENEKTPDAQTQKEKAEKSSNAKQNAGSGRNTNGRSKSSKGSSKKSKSMKGLEMELKAQAEILDDVSAKLKKAEEEKNQLVDKYQRLMAEFENMRKRTEKESKRMYDIGAKEVLEKLLPVIDNFERAQLSLTEEQKEDPFVQGVDKIYRQLLDYLTSVKVAPMDAEGKEFDPDLHNAVMHIEDDAYEENVVVEELQKGYMYKEEVLRHSMVKVAN